MRHGKKLKRLSRTEAHRKALLRNLSIALITHKRIKTTVTKAKALRGFLEPLVTKARTDSTHTRRLVFSALQNKEAIKELFDEVAFKVGDRPGGYLRVIKTGFRKGDGAEMAIVEFVDYNDVYSPKAERESDTKAGTRRTRRGRKKSTGEGQAEAQEAGAEAETKE